MSHPTSPYLATMTSWLLVSINTYLKWDVWSMVTLVYIVMFGELLDCESAPLLRTWHFVVSVVQGWALHILAYFTAMAQHFIECTCACMDTSSCSRVLHIPSVVSAFLGMSFFFLPFTAMYIWHSISLGVYVCMYMCACACACTCVHESFVHQGTYMNNNYYSFVQF